ncbi:hypothetical protein EVAR_46528_1 [Eumeta japonica]|uniref:Uncharacterized protein n=1 Tax=Eumeta variegata TaxID=151549 RepID=A0A4C1WSD9_EUMVA|nr:hypothetical protein EVAR_46528_1 [Eumeta japonica]
MFIVYDKTAQLGRFNFDEELYLLDISSPQSSICDNVIGYSRCHYRHFNEENRNQYARSIRMSNNVYLRIIKIRVQFAASHNVRISAAVNFREKENKKPSRPVCAPHAGCARLARTENLLKYCTAMPASPMSTYEQVPRPRGHVRTSVRAGTPGGAESAPDCRPRRS